MRVLVTGGAGYIGSHTCVELLMAGHDVVVIDNLSNSKPVVFDRMERICGRRPVFYREDVRSREKAAEILSSHDIEAVIHFAGLKAVGESVAQPLRYYENNVTGSLALFGAMMETGVRTLVFSSSATVYGNPHAVPIREDFPLSATNPYGRSKWMVEEMLRDLALADNSWEIALLRYFNPVGAHESGLIGEDPAGIPNNLMPYICQVAVGRRDELWIFGGDYPTSDGTGVRDYIHVVDLADGHIAALDWLRRRKGVHTFNLGTGQGKSVLEVVRAFEAASGQPIPYRITDRRPGDIAQCYAEPSHARQELGWRAQRGIAEMCRDAWNWQVKNPQGYEDPTTMKTPQALETGNLCFVATIPAVVHSFLQGHIGAAAKEWQVKIVSNPDGAELLSGIDAQFIPLQIERKASPWRDLLVSGPTRRIIPSRAL